MWAPRSGLILGPGLCIIAAASINGTRSRSEDEMSGETVVILGASPKPERYSNKALRLLRSRGHKVIPVHPAVDRIDGLTVKRSLREIDESVDTLTLYVGPERGEALAEDIVALRPRRVIFNPGTESPRLEGRLAASGIACVFDCTLVMLNAGRF